MKFKKSETILALIDNRSGVQIAMAQGQGRKTISRLARGRRRGFGACRSGGEGKVIGLAFADAYSNLVRSLRDYRTQEVDGGLGMGGA